MKSEKGRTPDQQASSITNGFCCEQPVGKEVKQQRQKAR